MIIKITNKILVIFWLLLVAITSLTACQQEPQTPTFSEIIERGYINIGTLFGPSSYYLSAEGPAGFEYELAKKYADSLGVKLNIIPTYTLEELLPKLENGDVDFVAAGVTVTSQRMQKYDFAPSYLNVSQKLVFKQGKTWPRSVEQIKGSLVVPSNTSYVEKLQLLKAKHPELIWQETSEFDSEELLEQILNDEIDFTVIDDNQLAISRRYYPDISIAFTLDEAKPLAWAVNKNMDDALLTSLVEFFGQRHYDGSLLVLKEKYYGHIEKFNYVDTRAFMSAIEESLPKYQALFEKYSQVLDWRLLAAISYQESHWNPKAKSYTGVRGMMMLTLPTAKQMGITSRIDAEQSIQGGAKYIQLLIDKMPARIPQPDRTWLALAAYNLGFGHLNDARIITERQGGDPDRWLDVKPNLPLLKQKKYYKQTKYGFARGDEAVNYVENIRRYYDTLRWVTEKKAN